MMKNIYLITTLFFLCSFSVLKAQLNVSDSAIKLFYVSASYTYEFSDLDLGDRFGNFSDIGLSITLKTKKNLLFGIEGTYQFGGDIVEPNLGASLTNGGGFIYNGNGDRAYPSSNQEGITVSLLFGKVFPTFGPNPNSGIRLQASAGYIQHKINIQELNNSVPQLVGDYLKGYDRLTGGFLLKQFVGYHFTHNNRVLNFNIGFEFAQGFTKSYRKYNYDLEMFELDSRLDLYYGIKFSWMIPMYKRPPKDYYYN